MRTSPSSPSSSRAGVRVNPHPQGRHLTRPHLLHQGRHPRHLPQGRYLTRPHLPHQGLGLGLTLALKVGISPGLIFFIKGDILAIFLKVGILPDLIFFCKGYGFDPVVPISRYHSAGKSRRCCPCFAIIIG